MALNNRTIDQINSDRTKHYAWINKNYPDAEILNTLILDMPVKNVKNNPLWFFGKNIMEHLSVADLLIVPYDWEDIRGVRSLKFVAEQYGVPVIVMP